MSQSNSKSQIKNNHDDELMFFRDSVVFYIDPTEPVGEDEWEVMKDSSTLWT